MFGCEGGGGSGSPVERSKITTSGLHLDAREVVVAGILGVIIVLQCHFFLVMRLIIQ